MDPLIDKKYPLLISFQGELMITSKINMVAQKLGYRTFFIPDAKNIGQVDQAFLDNQPGEPVFGREANLIDQLTILQPALLVFDLSNERVPWQAWIAAIKSSPATRRIPILCYGPHVNIEAMSIARSLDVEAVVPRSKFINLMPDLLGRYSRLWDYQAISFACDEPIDENASKGLTAFNAGEYFDAHEYLEVAWNQDMSAAREMYRAILQVAVAYLQIQRQNYRGAVKMFLRARQWLEPLPGICRGIDIAQLKYDANKAYEALRSLGPDGIKSYDTSYLKPIRYQQSP